MALVTLSQLPASAEWFMRGFKQPGERSLQRNAEIADAPTQQARTIPERAGNCPAAQAGSLAIRQIGNLCCDRNLPPTAGDPDVTMAAVRPVTGLPYCPGLR